MHWTKTFLIAAGFVSIAAITPAVADTQAERLEVARAYLTVSMKAMNLEKMALVSAQPILTLIRKKQPALYAQKGDKLRTIIKTVLMNVMQTTLAGLDQKLAAIYTLTELKAMTRFFTSDVGLAVMAKMPQYMAALQPAMQTAIRQSLPELFTRLGEEGVQLR